MNNNISFSNRESGESFLKLPKNVQEYLNKNLSSAIYTTENIDKDYLETFNKLKSVLNNLSDDEIGIIAIREVMSGDNNSNKSEEITMETKNESPESQKQEIYIDREKHFDRYKEAIKQILDLDNIKTNDDMIARIGESMTMIAELNREYYNGNGPIQTEITHFIEQLDIENEHKLSDGEVIDGVSLKYFFKDIISKIQQFTKADYAPDFEKDKLKNDEILNDLFNTFKLILTKTNYLNDMYNEALEDESAQYLLILKKDLYKIVGKDFNIGISQVQNYKKGNKLFSK